MVCRDGRLLILVGAALNNPVLYPDRQRRTDRLRDRNLLLSMYIPGNPMGLNSVPALSLRKRSKVSLREMQAVMSLWLQTQRPTGVRPGPPRILAGVYPHQQRGSQLPDLSTTMKTGGHQTTSEQEAHMPRPAAKKHSSPALCSAAPAAHEHRPSPPTRALEQTRRVQTPNRAEGIEAPVQACEAIKRGITTPRARVILARTSIPLSPRLYRRAGFGSSRSLQTSAIVMDGSALVGLLFLFM